MRKKLFEILESFPITRLKCPVQKCSKCKFNVKGECKVGNMALAEYLTEKGVGIKVNELYKVALEVDIEEINGFKKELCKNLKINNTDKITIDRLLERAEKRRKTKNGRN